MLHDEENGVFQEILLKVFPCSLPDKNDCATEKEVNRMILVFRTMNRLVVSTDKNDPLRVMYGRDDIRLDTHNTK